MVPAMLDHPSQIGGFTILRRIGEGTFSDVFRASDVSLQRDVAIKRMRQAADRTQRERALTEARLQAQLGFHPHLVPILRADFDQDGRLYLVMPLAEGTLRDRIGPAQGGAMLDLREACTILWEAGLGLQAVHQCGFVHRDVKPENILRYGALWKLGDFGLTRQRAAGVTQPSGTPLYMCPVQHAGTVDPRCDVFALGVLLYEMLAGFVPHRGDTAEQVLDAARKGQREPLPTGMSPAVSSLVAACLAPALDARPADATEFLRALRELFDPTPLAPADLTTALATLRNAHSGFQVKLGVHRVGAVRTRNFEVVPRTPTFVIGEEFTLSVTATEECHITLLGIGPDGHLTVLLPNDWAPNVRLPSDSVREFPGQGGDYTYRLAAPAGRHTLKVLATRQPFDHAAFSAPGGSGLRVWGSDADRDLAVLAGSVGIGRLPPGEWAEAAVDLEVRARG